MIKVQPGEIVASIPGLPELRFLIACGMQKLHELEGLVNLTTCTTVDILEQS